MGCERFRGTEDIRVDSLLDADGTGSVTVFLGILVLAIGGAAMLRFRSIKVD